MEKQGYEKMRVEDIKKSLNPLTRWHLEEDLSYLPKVLQENEEVIAFCLGSPRENALKSVSPMGILVATNTRIFFLSKKAFKVKFQELSYKEIKNLKKEDFLFKSTLTFELTTGNSYVIQHISPKKGDIFLEKIKLLSS